MVYTSRREGNCEREGRNSDALGCISLSCFCDPSLFLSLASVSHLYLPAGSLVQRLVGVLVSAFACCRSCRRVSRRSRQVASLRSRRWASLRSRREVSRRSRRAASRLAPFAIMTGVPAKINAIFLCTRWDLNTISKLTRLSSNCISRESFLKKNRLIVYPIVKAVIFFISIYCYYY
jgi:hypothetical protein